MKTKVLTLISLVPLLIQAQQAQWNDVDWGAGHRKILPENNGWILPSAIGAGSAGLAAVLIFSLNEQGKNSETHNAPCSVAMTPTIVPSLCASASGEVVIILDDGSIPEVEWPDGFTGNSRNGLEAGMYEIEVSDGACTENFIIEIPANNFPVPINLLDSSPPSGPGMTDGAIYVGISEGWKPGPFVFSINGVEAPPTMDLFFSVKGLGEGIYIIEVIDANGCVGLIEVELVFGEFAPPPDENRSRKFQLVVIPFFSPYPLSGPFRR